jgi:hypothetical protein
VQVGEHVAGAIGRPWQSQVAVQVGEQVPLAGAMGRPEQSHVDVQVGEQVMALPAQSQVAVQVGEHLAGAIGRP